MNFTADAEREVLTLEEAADFLRISRPTMLELARNGSIAGRQIGRQWRFSREILLHHLTGKDGVSRSRRKNER